MTSAYLQWLCHSGEGPVALLCIWEGGVGGRGARYYHFMFLLKLSAHHRSVFSFSAITSAHVSSTKNILCIDFVEIWFLIANGQILSIFIRQFEKWNILCDRIWLPSTNFFFSG